MEYTDEKLQDHELNFWLNSYKGDFFHLKFYQEFFNFSELSEKKTVDIGCGGAPISDYCGVNNINLTIVDPLIDKLIKHDKFKHLSKYDYSSNSLFDFNGADYEYLVCLNVVDHFNDSEYSFVDKFSSILKVGGFVWLYYDVRDINDGDHLSINNEKLINKIKENFEIIRMDESINPTHRGWSSVNKSVRIIAKKK
jgi:2-polyprenyl-3-methyl-5-hydroxy-6-metoxy-1,4-benzoquinol methylase